MNENKYYAITVKCGHVGRNKYIPITFPIIANSKKKAAEVVRLFPRVKHDHKDYVLDAREVTREEYLDILEKNNNDIYLKVASIQEQREKCLDLEERLCQENRDNQTIKREDRNDRVKYIQKKNKNHIKDLMKYKMEMILFN